MTLQLCSKQPSSKASVLAGLLVLAFSLNGLYAQELVDLSKASIIVRDGQLPAAEKIASAILSEEVQKRSGCVWEATRQRLPSHYPLRWYPDITHIVRCQYPIPWLDPTWGVEEGRVFGRSLVPDHRISDERSEVWRKRL